MLDPEVFKAYDVRGLYPAELDEAGAYAIGRAYVEQFEPRRIAVGRDMRLSSPTMAAAVIDGAADGGADVVDLGMVGTEMVYFAVGELGLDGGVMVTASHNPKRVHRHEDRAPRRAAGRQRVGAARGPRPGAARRSGARRRAATVEPRGRLGSASSSGCSRSSTSTRSRPCAS